MREQELTYQVRGAIFDTYNTLGPGLLEAVYEEALAYFLTKRGLRVDRQVSVPVEVDGKRLETQLRIDLLVERRIIVELKSVEELKPVHHKQLLTYLKLMDKRLGLLINFNVTDIMQGISRVVNNL